MEVHIMTKGLFRRMIILCLILFAVAAAGCGAGERRAGLSPEGVVEAFYQSAKEGRIGQAALYIAPGTELETVDVARQISGLAQLRELRSTNLVDIRQVASQGDFAVVLATIQTQNSLRTSVKAVGLEWTDGEWYIVDSGRMLANARYRILADLFRRI